MSTLKRLTDILSANLNELIERYEDPELLLKQAVREMEESIRIALSNAVKVVSHEKILARQLADAEAAAALWLIRAEAAIQRTDDTSAREALRNKRDREAASRSLAIQLTEATEVGKTLRRQIETTRLRVDEAKRKLVLLAARQRAGEARQRLLHEFANMPLGDDAFHKFDRMCRKVEQTEAEADALAELTGGVAAELDFGTRDNTATDELETELRDLKARCGA